MSEDAAAPAPPRRSISEFNDLMQIEYLALAKAKQARKQQKQAFKERRWAAHFALTQAMVAREHGYDSLRQFYAVLSELPAPPSPQSPLPESSD